MTHSFPGVGIQGSIVRFNMVDTSNTWASFDYPLHAAGRFIDIRAL
jgi:hypothetical protein